MTDNFVDFRTIKDRITIEAVLGHYGIRLRGSNRVSIRGKCPLPTHTSKESSESFSAQTEKNIWACQSSSCAANRGGKKGGNILDFVSIMESCSVRDAALKLQNWFLIPSPTSSSTGKGRGATTEVVVEQKHDANDVETNKPLSFTLKDIDAAHPYLRSRGLKEETARHFGVGYFSGRGSMSGRIVIPIANERGELVAYAGRAVDDSEPKYKLPAGFKKSAVLFNLDRVFAQPRPPDVLIIVEGFFDCMKVCQAGLPYVVALMGSSLSDEQQALLQTFESVLLFLDGDDAGRAAAQSIAGRLVHRIFVKVLDVPDGKQPDQLSSDEIKAIIFT